MEVPIRGGNWNFADRPFLSNLVLMRSAVCKKMDGWL